MIERSIVSTINAETAVGLANCSTESNFVLSHRYLYLFISQLTLVVIYPALGNALGLRILLEAFLLIALLGGIVFTIANRLRFLLSLFLGIAFLITRWSVYLLGASALTTISYAVGAVFFAYIAAVIMGHIFMARERVDTDLIIGSISVYLLLGSTFGFVYITLNLLAPGSFSGVEAVVGDPDVVVQEFIYFSFVTLTTLGYGDITPLTHQAGVLAYIEAIIGQVYLTVLVARLVGMHIAQQTGSR